MIYGIEKVNECVWKLISFKHSPQVLVTNRVKSFFSIKGNALILLRFKVRLEELPYLYCM